MVERRASLHATRSSHSAGTYPVAPVRWVNRRIESRDALAPPHTHERMRSSADRCAVA